MSIISDIEALRFRREPSYSKRVGSIVNALRDHTDIAKAQQKRIDELEALVNKSHDVLTEPELKPCPFCDSMDIKLMRDNNAARYTHRVICMNCGVSTQGTTYTNDEYNISCWNKRGGK